jgi:hypothetical protein
MERRETQRRRTMPMRSARGSATVKRLLVDVDEIDALRRGQ